MRDISIYPTQSHRICTEVLGRIGWQNHLIFQGVQIATRPCAACIHPTSNTLPRNRSRPCLEFPPAPLTQQSDDFRLKNSARLKNNARAPVLRVLLIKNISALPRVTAPLRCLHSAHIEQST